MRIVKPAEIPGKVMSLIDEADTELTVISPCASVEWPALFSSLQKATDRGVKISFFVGKDVEFSAGFYDLNVQVYYAEKLHAKMYLNEKQAVFTSMNFAKAADHFAIDFGIETENREEFEEVKKTYLPFIQKSVTAPAYFEKGSFKIECFKNPTRKTFKDQYTSANAPHKKMCLFEAHFQKTFRRHNLMYSREKNFISCSNFPFEWTDFEYSGMIKISFLSAWDFDYKKFRKESISEFNSLFSNHKTYWSYPYDSIRIYGDEAANGINANDIHAQINYHSWLIKEVTRFLETKEDVLLKTPLYRFRNCSEVDDR